MQKFTVLAIDHTREYIHYADPSLKSYNDRVKYGSVRNKREHRCDHGFLCDPEPGQGAVWLCPHCKCPWGGKRTKCGTGNNGAARVVAEALKKEPKSKQELYELVGDRLTRDQIYNALHSLNRSGRSIPAEIWSPKPRKRRDGLPDESRAQ